MTRVISTAGAMILAMLVAGCTSGPTIYSNTNPMVDLRDYQTFGYARQLGTNRRSGEQTIVSTYLIQTTRGEMEKRGYRYSENNPDLELNFYLHSQEKIRTTTTPSSGMGGGYYGYRSGYYGTWGGYETRVTQYTEGTLNIDVVDNAKDLLVWEGTAVGRLRDNPDKLEERAHAVVGEIFAEFPLSMPGG